MWRRASARSGGPAGTICTALTTSSRFITGSTAAYETLCRSRRSSRRIVYRPMTFCWRGSGGGGGATCASGAEAAALGRDFTGEEGVGEIGTKRGLTGASACPITRTPESRPDGELPVLESVLVASASTIGDDVATGAGWGA